MYSGVSSFVEGVDTAFAVILGISFFFLIGLTAVMLYFVFRYNKNKHPKATQIEGSNILEIIWTVIPTILVLLMFYYGWKGWSPMQRIPDNAMPVTVEGRMWKFTFEYANGRRTDTLYVPVNTPIKLDLKAIDVIHSFYVPAFRVKADMVPGLKDNFSWFEAKKAGNYDIFCAEYCGLNHSYMNTEVVVLPQASFQEWYLDTTQYKKTTTTGEINPAQMGREILGNTGCIACHSYDGTKLIGPSFKGLWGKQEAVITNGKQRDIVVDSIYIVQSIYEPDADIVKGFRKGQMVSYKNDISTEEINYIIEFLKTIND